MRIEQNLKRNVLMQWLLSFIPDIIIALLIARFTKSAFFGFLVAIVSLQIIYTAIWLKNIIWSWIVFYWFGKNKLITFLYDFLIENEFPKPKSCLESVEDYLEKTTLNDGYSIEVRLKSAAELSALMTTKIQFNGLYTQFIIAYEEALQKYRHKFILEKNDE